MSTLNSIRVQVIPWKLCSVHVAINYTPLSMVYSAYDNTVNLRIYSAIIYISKEQCCKEELRGVGNSEFEPVIRKLR